MNSLMKHKQYAAIPRDTTPKTWAGRVLFRVWQWL